MARAWDPQPKLSGPIRLQRASDHSSSGAHCDRSPAANRPEEVVDTAKIYRRYRTDQRALLTGFSLRACWSLFGNWHCTQLETSCIGDLSLICDPEVTSFFSFEFE